MEPLDSWFLVTAIMLGPHFANDIRKAVTERGGKVRARSRHPLGDLDH